MSWKVKRGLGLLVVAAIALLVLVPLLNASPTGDVAAVLVVLAIAVVGFGFLAGLLGGLGLLAWGLLRD